MESRKGKNGKSKNDESENNTNECDNEREERMRMQIEEFNVSKESNSVVKKGEEMQRRST